MALRLCAVSESFGGGFMRPQSRYKKCAPKTLLSPNCTLIQHGLYSTLDSIYNHAVIIKNWQYKPVYMQPEIYLGSSSPQFHRQIPFGSMTRHFHVLRLCFVLFPA